MHTYTKSTALVSAIEGIQNGTYSCAVIQNNTLAFTDIGRGVAPLVRLYEGATSLLRNAEVADKIIGKAAAMILHLGGAVFVHGELMTEAAQNYLVQNNIPHSYNTLVPLLKNRTGTGPCPIESSVLGIDDAEEGYKNIQAAIAKLMAAQ